MAAEAALDAAWEANAAKAALRAKRDKLKKQLAEIVSMTGSADESLNSAQIGETVRWHRQANQLTQAQLGERMAQAGFPWHKSTVSKTESGQRDTTVRELIALARIFEVSASALVSMPATALIEAQLKGAAPVAADPKKVRAWAAEQGYEVAPSGQIPKAIMADYLDATSGGAA
jgi:transcriptional regulator with XRE-family HTH domain